MSSEATVSNRLAPLSIEPAHHSYEPVMDRLRRGAAIAKMGALAIGATLKTAGKAGWHGLVETGKWADRHRIGLAIGGAVVGAGCMIAGGVIAIMDMHYYDTVRTMIGGVLGTSVGSQPPKLNPLHDYAPYGVIYGGLVGAGSALSGIVLKQAKDQEARLDAQAEGVGAHRRQSLDDLLDDEADAVFDSELDSDYYEPLHAYDALDAQTVALPVLQFA